MTRAEMGRFLREPRISMLATVRPDNSPHLTPVWHHFDGEKVLVLAEPSAVKVRNIQQNPRVSLCVATVSEPHMYVLVSGTATLSDEWDPELLWTMSVDYQGQVEGERYAERVFREVRFSLISLTPLKMIGVREDEI